MAEETREEEVFLATPSVSMWPCKNISDIKVLVINFFPTPPIKLKPGLQVGGRLLIPSHKSTNQTIYPIRSSGEQSINTIWLCLLDWNVPRLVHCSEKLCMFSGYYQSSSGSLDLMGEPVSKKFQCRVTYWALVGMLLVYA